MSRGSALGAHPIRILIPGLVPCELPAACWTSELKSEDWATVRPLRALVCLLLGARAPTGQEVCPCLGAAGPS